MHRFSISIRFFSDRSLLLRPSLIFIGLCLLLSGGAPSSIAQSAKDRTILPAQFNANRIHVTPVTAEGDTLRLFTDTGGGRHPVLTKSAVEQLDLSVTDTISQGERSIPVVPFPNVEEIPGPNRSRALVFPGRRHVQLLDLGDGMLGQGWFAGNVWTIDYGAKRFLHLSTRNGISFDPQHTVDLGFKTDTTGQRTSNHPRIEATIGGERHSFLLDTGATSVLADSARRTLEWPKRVGSSFVIASLFEQWKREHPDWKVVEGASVFRRGTPIIRVPEVTVAGHTVGPVWFERRPNRAFQEGMAQSMDEPIDGALGGSLLQYFRMTVDYPDSRAHFERIK